MQTPGKAQVVAVQSDRTLTSAKASRPFRPWTSRPQTLHTEKQQLLILTRIADLCTRHQDPQSKNPELVASQLRLGVWQRSDLGSRWFSKVWSRGLNK